MIEKMTRDELRAYAKAQGLKGYGKLTKQGLIDLIGGASKPAPTTVEEPITVEEPAAETVPTLVEVAAAMPHPLSLLYNVDNERYSLAMSKLKKACNFAKSGKKKAERYFRKAGELFSLALTLKAEPNTLADAAHAA